MRKRFNVRVYGLLIVKDAVLVSDEYIKGHKITKFPGGGLEFGEGTRECLEREFREELALTVKVTDHFYTTDFYVASAFDSSSQVISIYYMVEPLEEMRFRVSKISHDYGAAEGAQSLRWLSLETMSERDFTLIIDKKVAELLLSRYKPL